MDTTLKPVDFVAVPTISQNVVHILCRIRNFGYATEQI